MSAALIDLETEDFATAAHRLIVLAVDPIGTSSRQAWHGLSGCGGMAGSDAGGVEWASSYDQAAATALNAAVEAGGAVGQLARMFAQTARNYELADTHSAPSVRHRLAGVVASVPPVPRLALPGCTPPSAAGSGSTGGPPGWGLVSHAVGYVWPNGHQDRLHHAASVWRASASSLRGAADTVLAAPQSAQHHLLPEAADMTTVCQDVSDHLREIADVHDQLADACLQLAEHIDHVHSQVIGELKSLLEWTVGIEAGGAVLSFFTFGAAEVPTQAMEASRIARTAEIVSSCIQRFIAVARTLGSAVAEVAEVAGLLAARLRRFVQLPLLEPALAGVGPLRVLSQAGEVGALGRLEMAATSRTLAEAEKIGGHTITRHVGLTDEELIARGKRVASTFTDLDTAETVTARNLAAHQREIASWLQNPAKRRLVIEGPASPTDGRVYISATKTFVNPACVRTILLKRGKDYFVRTSFLLP